MMDKKNRTMRAYVRTIPECSFCLRMDGIHTPAMYDGKTTIGPWAFMCMKHMRQYGLGLGIGKGQRLIKS
jgi:hypothetical protein